MKQLRDVFAYWVNRLLNAHGGTGYHYSGLDAVEEAFANIPLVQKYLEP